MVQNRSKCCSLKFVRRVVNSEFACARNKSHPVAQIVARYLCLSSLDFVSYAFLGKPVNFRFRF